MQEDNQNRETELN